MLSLYRFLVRAGTRSQIKHGEIGEDSKAAPEKLNHQPFAKNQKLAPQVPQTPHFVVICVTRSDLEDSDDQAW